MMRIFSNISSLIPGTLIGLSALFFSAGSAMAATDYKGAMAVSPSVERVQIEEVSINSIDERTYFVQNHISAAKAKSIALSRVRGGTYVNLSKKGNTYIVRVRDQNGRLIDIKIDAITGRVK